MTDILHPVSEMTVFGKHLADEAGHHKPAIYCYGDYKSIDWSHPAASYSVERIDVFECFSFRGDSVEWKSSAHQSWGTSFTGIDCLRHRTINSIVAKFSVKVEIPEIGLGDELTNKPLAWTQEKHDEVCAGCFQTVVEASNIDIDERMDNMESFIAAYDVIKEARDWLASDPVIQSADYGEIKLSLALHRRCAEGWKSRYLDEKAKIEARAADPAFRAAKTKLGRALKLFRKEVHGRALCKATYWDEGVREVPVHFYHRDDASDTRGSTKIIFRCHIEPVDYVDQCSRVTMAARGSQLTQSDMANRMGENFSALHCKQQWQLAVDVLENNTARSTDDDARYYMLKALISEL